MKRLALFSLILTILVGVDGFYMLFTKYQPKDVHRFNLSDGGTVIILAILLLIVTVTAFILSKKQGESPNV